MNEEKTFTIADLDDAVTSEILHFVEVGKQNKSGVTSTAMFSMAMMAFAAGVKNRLVNPEKYESKETDKEMEER